MSGCCGDSKWLIYPCSGSADVGEIADQVARKLRDAGYGKMSCLAGLGAHISGFVESAKNARNIAIDGCQVGCVTKIFAHHGIPVHSYVLTEMGLIKGKTKVTLKVIDKIIKQIANDIPKKSAKGKSSCER
jgi:uncharacterized metal-binding protein